VTSSRLAVRARVRFSRPCRWARTSQPRASSSHGQRMPVPRGAMPVSMGTRRSPIQVSTSPAPWVRPGRGSRMSASVRGVRKATRGSTRRLARMPHQGAPPWKSASRGRVDSQGAANWAKGRARRPSRGDSRPARGSAPHSRPSRAHQARRKPGSTPAPGWPSSQRSRAMCRPATGGSFQPVDLPRAQATPMKRPRHTGAEKPTSAEYSRPPAMAPRAAARSRSRRRSASMAAITRVTCRPDTTRMWMVPLSAKTLKWASSAGGMPRAMAPQRSLAVELRGRASKRRRAKACSRSRREGRAGPVVSRSWAELRWIRRGASSLRARQRGRSARKTGAGWMGLSSARSRTGVPGAGGVASPSAGTVRGRFRPFMDAGLVQAI